MSVIPKDDNYTPIQTIPYKARTRELLSVTTSSTTPTITIQKGDIIHIKPMTDTILIRWGTTAVSTSNSDVIIDTAGQAFIIDGDETTFRAIALSATTQVYIHVY